MIENIINNKKYIGLTKRNIDIRWHEHIKKSNSSKISEFSLQKDIYTFGKDNFKLSLLKECESEDEMIFFEKKYISYYQTMQYGYNLNSGGKVYNLSDNYRKEMSVRSKDCKEVFVYRTNGDFVERFNSINNTCLSLKIDNRVAFRVLSGHRKSCNGYILRHTMDNSPKIDSRNLSIKSFKDGVLIKKYDSIKECSLETGIRRCYIERVVSGKRKHHKGIYYTK